MVDDLVGGERVGKFEIVRLIGTGGMGAVYEALDRELARSVALKILRGSTQHLRLVREAQTLAQLQHPNVVAIHDLEVHGDQLCIAMELVDGETLDKHIERTRPDWPRIVALYVQAGRGLAAAHAKGIVHRDVKPANLFVDGSGRVRVGDFGLARVIEDTAATVSDGELVSAAPSAQTVDDPIDLLGSTIEATPQAPGSPRVELVTRAGAIVGTPLFMAPEQHQGRRAMAATDQFGFCVALWIALFGTHPFAIEGGVATAVTTGRRRPTPRGAVPRWLVRLLDRGLATDPTARHPSMTALLDRIEAYPRRRRAIVAIAGAAVVTGGLVTWGIGRGAEAATCPVPDAQVASVWSPKRAAAMKRVLATLDPRRGEARAAGVERQVDELATAWRAAHVAACSASQNGAQSPQLLDARMRCLADRLDDLDRHLAHVTDATDLGAADDAIQELVKLTPPKVCSDRGMLAAELASPLRPEQRAIANAIVRELREMEHVHPEQRPEKLGALAARARTLGHAPTTSRVLKDLAEVHLYTDHIAEAEQTLRELAQIAAAAHDDRDEAYAWIRLVGIVGTQLAKPVEGLALVEPARAAIARAGNPVDLRADLLYREAMVLGGGEQWADGIKKLEEERKILEAAGAPGSDLELTVKLADSWFQAGTIYGQASAGGADTVELGVKAFHRAIEIDRAALGPDSNDEVYSWGNLSQILKIGRRLDEARDAARQAVRIVEITRGESLGLASSLDELAGIEGAAKAYPEALAANERALKIYRAKLGPDDLQLSAPLLNHAWIVSYMGRRAEQIQGLGDVIALHERAKVTTPDLAIAHQDRAEATATDCPKSPAATIADYVRAEEVYEHQYGPTSPTLVAVLFGHGRCLVIAGRAADGIPLLERALALAPPEKAIARATEVWLGRALVAAKRDPARGRALEAKARAALVAAAPTDEEAAGELHDLDTRPRK